MRTRPFPADEFAARVEKARRAATSARWDGLLVLARGGGPIDRHGHLCYLTDAYSSFPTIPDLGQAWHDRGYAAALISSHKVIVCGDDAALADGGAVADEVRIGHDVLSLVTGAVRDLGLAASSLGLAGADVLTWRQHQRLMSGLPALVLHDADEALLCLRMVKSPAEIEVMRRAANAGARAMDSALKRITSNVTEADICAGIASDIISAGGWMANSFAYTFGEGAYDPRKRMPTIDSFRKLIPGDLTTLDISGAFEGYYFDLARSRVVDTAPTATQSRMLELTRNVVDTVASELEPGKTIADAARSGAAMLDRAGYDSAHDEFQALGHGLGLGFEPPWIRLDNDTIIRPGMCLAIEKFCSDGVTGATHERNILITESGPVDLAPLLCDTDVA